MVEKCYRSVLPYVTTHRSEVETTVHSSLNDENWYEDISQRDSVYDKPHDDNLIDKSRAYPEKGKNITVLFNEM